MTARQPKVVLPMAGKTLRVQIVKVHLFNSLFKFFIIIFLVHPSTSPKLINPRSGCTIANAETAYPDIPLSLNPAFRSKVQRGHHSCTVSESYLAAQAAA
jgi:hypothetical protein